MLSRHIVDTTASAFDKSLLKLRVIFDSSTATFTEDTLLLNSSTKYVVLFDKDERIPVPELIEILSTIKEGKELHSDLINKVLLD
jgi:hypothetical protein